MNYQIFAAQWLSPCWHRLTALHLHLIKQSAKTFCAHKYWFLQTLSKNHICIVNVTYTNIRACLYHLYRFQVNSGTNVLDWSPPPLPHKPYSYTHTWRWLQPSRKINSSPSLYSAHKPNLGTLSYSGSWLAIVAPLARNDLVATKLGTAAVLIDLLLNSSRCL